VRLLFDIETDGFLAEVTQVHCIVAFDMDTREWHIFRPDQVAQGIDLLASADETYGHNIVGFDWPVIQKLYRKPRTRRGGMIDTKSWSRASYPTLGLSDTLQLRKNPRWIPSHLIGWHSIEAWAFRLGRGLRKVEHEDWSKFSEEMLQRCIRDVEINVQLFEFLQAKGHCPENAARIETEVQWILERQKRHGVAFNERKAEALHVKLLEHVSRIEPQLRTLYAPWWVPNGSVVGKKTAEVTPKRDNKKLGIEKGCPYTKIKLMHFNPTSRDQIIDRLMKVRGWKPRPDQLTPTGRPELSEEIMAALPWPECKPLAEMLMLKQRLGMLVEGKKAFMKMAVNGRLHGTVNGTGARTARMSHSDPNMNVPKVGSEYGAEMRELFEADDGQVLVGVDASGLELRMLGSALAPWDGGEYAKEVTDGDPHKYLMRVTDVACDEHAPQHKMLDTLPPSTDRLAPVQTARVLTTPLAPLDVRAVCKKCRDRQKTRTYADLYGAGDKKKAKITGRTPEFEKAVSKRIFAKIPAFKELAKALDAAYSRRRVRLPDGRRAPTNSRHDTLNTKLQGDGAIVMKVALVAGEGMLLEAGLRPIEEHFEDSPIGQGDYEYVLNVHDEWQTTTKPEHAEFVGETQVKGIRVAGELLGIRCRLDGEAKVGANWKETH
jgi:DNA polymerase-1